MSEDFASYLLNAAMAPQLMLSLRPIKHSVNFNPDNQAAYNAPFTISEHHALSSCTSHSPGLDSIPNSLLREMSSDQHLLHFYNYVHLPNRTNCSCAQAAKPGGLSSHCCYFRPITLVNCLSKVLEKMVS